MRSPYLDDYASAWGDAASVEDTNDNWLGTILLVTAALLAAIASLALETVLGGASPPRLLLWHVGVPAAAALVAGLAAGLVAALVRGENPSVVRSAVGLLVAAAGLALIHHDLRAPGAFIATIGLMIVARRIWIALRELVELPAERFGRARWALVTLVVAQAAAGGGPGLGTLRLAALAALAWPLVPGTADVLERGAARLGRLRDLFRPREEPLPEPEPYVDPYAKYTLQQQRKIRMITGFITQNFNSGKFIWENPRVTAVLDAPSFTSYVLEVPTAINVTSVVAREADFALAMRAEGPDAVQVIQAPKMGGVMIQERKEQAHRTKAWFHEVFTVARKAGAINLEEDDPERLLEVVVGVDEQNRPVMLNMGDIEEPHLLLAGGSGSGKSYLLNVLLVQLVARNSPDQLQIAMIDPKSTLAMRYKTLPHLFRPPILGVHGAAQLIREVEEERQRRDRVLEQAQVAHIHIYNRRVAQGLLPGPPMPFLILVIDEAASISTPADDKSAEGKELVAAYNGWVSSIAQKGRNTGVSLLLALQRPSQESVGRFVRGNVQKRLVLRLIDKNEAMLASPIDGDTSATKLGGRGDGYLFTGAQGRRRFSGAYLPDGPGADRDGEFPTVHVEAYVAQAVRQWASLGYRMKDFEAARAAAEAEREAAAAAREGRPEAVAGVAEEARRRIAAEHGPDCTDREWLIIAGVQLAVAGSDPYATAVLTPESIEPFVRRAADERGWRGDPFDAEEIQRALGRFFAKAGRPPQRERTWPLNGFVVQSMLVDRYAAPPAPEEPKGAAAPRSDRVSDVRSRARRDP